MEFSRTSIINTLIIANAISGRGSMMHSLIGTLDRMMPGTDYSNLRPSEKCCKMFNADFHGH